MPLLLFIFLTTWCTCGSLVGWSTTKKRHTCATRIFVVIVDALLLLPTFTLAPFGKMNHNHHLQTRSEASKSTTKQLIAFIFTMKNVLTLSMWVKCLGWIVGVILSVSQVCMNKISPCWAVIMPVVYLAKQLGCWPFRSGILLINFF